MAQDKSRLLSKIPSVEHVLNLPAIAALVDRTHRAVVVDTVRRKLDEHRRRLKESKDKTLEITEPALINEITHEVEDFLNPSLVRAINGIGVILHTGLGRAPFSPAARQAIANAAENFSNLAIDREKGKRAERYRHVEGLLGFLTGAEASVVVNNNAAATLLILDTLTRGREVIVSRGQLVEIGGSFRIPDIMAKGGATMVEVGTTNRTHLKDYRSAITPNTGALLRVHTSNYKITGFVAEVPLVDLVALGKEHKLLVIDDLGSGALVDLSKYGLPKEPMVQESIREGADVTCFSGDKLIGGPQCGIIVGRKKYIDQIKKNPLTRALRCGKLTYAALEATLRLFLDEDNLFANHATLGLIVKNVDTIRAQAEGFAEQVTKLLPGKLAVTVRQDRSEIGGGSLATESLPTFVAVLKPKSMKVEELALKLRHNAIPIFGRVAAGYLQLDFRTIREDEVPIIVEALEAVL